MYSQKEKQNQKFIIYSILAGCILLVFMPYYVDYVLEGVEERVRLVCDNFGYPFFSHLLYKLGLGYSLSYKLGSMFSETIIVTVLYLLFSATSRSNYAGLFGTVVYLFHPQRLYLLFASFIPQRFQSKLFFLVSAGAIMVGWMAWEIKARAFNRISVLTLILTVVLGVLLFTNAQVGYLPAVVAGAYGTVLHLMLGEILKEKNKWMHRIIGVCYAFVILVGVFVENMIMLNTDPVWLQ